jgi:hypothetical protein
VINTDQATSDLFWNVTLITIVFDAPLVFIAARWVSSELFIKLKWHLAVSAFIIYAVIWGAFASVYFWEEVYQWIFPDWTRWLLPLAFGIFYGLLAAAFWHISKFAGRWQSVCFILLGCIFSLVGHGIGISRGLFQVPLLANASAESMLTFGIFEFIFYWCAIVYLSVFLQWLIKHLGHYSV